MKTFRQTASDYFVVAGTVRWSPKVGQHVIVTDKLGEATGRIEKVALIAGIASAWVYITGHNNRLAMNIGKVVPVRLALLRPVNYRGALADLEIIDVVPSDRAPRSKTTGSARARR